MKINPLLKYAQKNWRIITVLIIGCILRFFLIGYASMWLDEAAAYLVADGPVSAIIPKNILVERTPPLFYYFLHGILYLNNSIFILRSFSAVLGCINILLFWHFIKRYFPDNRFVIIYFALSPFLIQNSQDIRVYQLLLTFVLITLILLYDVLVNKKPRYVALCLTLTLGLYTHYYFGFFYITVMLVMLTQKNWRSLISGLLSGIFLVPWVIIASPLKHGSVGAVMSGYPNDMRGILRVFGEFFTGSTFFTWDLGVLVMCIGGLVLCLIAVSFFLMFRCGNKWVGYITLLFITIPFILAYSLGSMFNKSFIFGRYFIIIVPMVYGLIGYVVSPHFLRKQAMFAHILLAGIMAFFLGGYYVARLKIDTKLHLVERKVRSLYQTGDQILHAHVWYYLPLKYYYLKDLNHHLLILREHRGDYAYLIHNERIINHTTISTKDDLDIVDAERFIVIDPLKIFNDRIIKVLPTEVFKKQFVEYTKKREQQE